MAWKTAEKILGRSKGARLMVLGIFLMTTGGIGIGVANFLRTEATVPSLMLAFGILSFITGLGMYEEEGRRSRRSRRRKGHDD